MRASAVIAEDLIALRHRQSELQARLNDLQGRPPSDAELVGMRETQARYDSLYKQMERVGAPGPMQNESARSYRRRLLSTFQPLSKDWREADLHNPNLDERTVDRIEDIILADAARVVADPTRGSFTRPGELRAIESMAEGGHRVREYKGDPLCWMSSFMCPAGVGRIRDPRRG